MPAAGRAPVRRWVARAIWCSQSRADNPVNDFNAAEDVLITRDIKSDADA